MMKFINDELEDYKDIVLYSYAMIFNDIIEDQREYLISHFSDYSWGQGLAISEAFVERNEAKSIFKFKSAKKFIDKSQSEWTEDDLKFNLVTNLIGKEQFFSNMYFSENGIDLIEITFISNEDIYKVNLSKYSSMEKI